MFTLMVTMRLLALALLTLLGSGTGYAQPQGPRGVVTPRARDVLDAAQEARQPAEVSGIVVDHLRAPVPAAIVRAHFLSLLGEPPLTTIAETDDRGFYRFEKLTPGRYVISAEAVPSAGEREQVKAPRVGPVPTFYPGVVSRAAAKAVTVRVGQRLTASFALVQGRLGCVRGSALDASGHPRGPSDGMFLSVLRQRYPGGGYPISLQPDGTFAACDIPPDDYHLLARCGTEAGYRPISVVGDDLTANIQTNSGATLSGRVVVRRGNETLIPLAAGAPSANVFFRADRVRGLAEDVFTLWGHSAPVADDGSFEMTGVRGDALLNAGLGAVWITPLSARAIPHRLASVMRGTEDVTTLPIRLLGTERVTDLTIVLTLDVGRVQGVIETEATSRPRRTHVFLFPADPTRWQDEAFVHMTPLSQDGSWRFDWVAAGPHYAIALDLGDEFYRVPDAATLEKLRARATPVAVKPGGTTVLTLQVSRFVP